MSRNSAKSPLRATRPTLDFRALVVATKAFVWTADANGNLLDIRNWRELRGENPAPFLGTSWIDLIHPDDRERTLQAWNEAVESKRDYSIEHQFVQPDDLYRWMLSRAVPIMLETGAAREWVGISSDIHDSKVWSVTTDVEQSVLTGAQIRAARGIVNWSVRELSEAARVSSSTIRRLEESNEAPASTEESLSAHPHSARRCRRRVPVSADRETWGEAYIKRNIYWAALRCKCRPS